MAAQSAGVLHQAPVQKPVPVARSRTPRAATRRSRRIVALI